jgi:hypothetical protein
MHSTRILTMIIIGVLLIFSCKSRKELEPNKNNSVTSSDKFLTTNNCLIVNETENFKTEFFPFDFSSYNTGKLRSYFNASVTVDSVESSNEGYISWIYTFRDNTSKISFFVKKGDTEDKYFYLEQSSIKSDLLKTKNGIRINISRNDFFNTIKISPSICDTFTIQEGDMATYYRFIFDKDKLKTIEIKPSE